MSAAKLSTPVAKVGNYEYYVIGPDRTTYFLIIRNYLAAEEAMQMMQYYKTLQGWYQPTWKIGEKEGLSPRLSLFVGDDECSGHTYANVNHDIHPWDPVSKQLRDRIVSELQVYLSAALLNWYRDGTDYIAAHRDREAIKGENQIVVGLSFGGTRIFKLVPENKDVDPSIKIEIRNGDLMVMSGVDLQKRYKHTIPRQKDVEERMSITFRNLTGKFVPYKLP